MTPAEAGLNGLPARAHPTHRLHVQMLIALGVGLLAGLLVSQTVGPEVGWIKWLIAHITQPISQLFLRALFMLVLPLLFSALVIGVSEMSDMRVLGRVGWRTAMFTVAGALVAVSIAVVLVNVVRPGEGVDRDVAQRLLASAAGNARAIVGESAAAGIGSNLVELVPNNIFRAAADNQLLPVMLFAFLFGVGLVLTPNPATLALRNTLEGVFNVSMTLIGLLIRIAPFAIACLVFDLAARFGWDLLARLGAYVGVVLLALLIQVGVVYALTLRFLAGVSPVYFLKQSQEAILTGFSTASSNATLPTTLLVAEKRLRIPKHVARFVLTVGAATNHHGTALFEGVTVLFLAQFFGVSLTVTQQIAAMALCVLASMGTAAVPAGSLPVVAAMLGLFGIPPEGIGLILGVDRFLDMCRTAVNVTGDLTAAVVVSRGEVLEPTAVSSAAHDE